MQGSVFFFSTGLGDAIAQTYLAARAHFSSIQVSFAEAVSNRHTLKTQHKVFLTKSGQWGDGLREGWRRGSQKMGEVMKMHLGRQPSSSYTLKAGAETEVGSLWSKTLFFLGWPHDSPNVALLESL